MMKLDELQEIEPGDLLVMSKAERFVVVLDNVLGLVGLHMQPDMEIDFVTYRNIAKVFKP